jgi:hypothetical protein
MVEGGYVFEVRCVVKVEYFRGLGWDGGGVDVLGGVGRFGCLEFIFGGSMWIWRSAELQNLVRRLRFRLLELVGKVCILADSCGRVCCTMGHIILG